MNMSRVQEVQVKLKQNDLIYVSIDMVLTPDRDMNRQHIENMDRLIFIYVYWRCAIVRIRVIHPHIVLGF